MFATKCSELNVFVEELFGVDLLRVMRLDEIGELVSRIRRHLVLNNQPAVHFTVSHLVRVDVEDEKLFVTFSEKLFNLGIMRLVPELTGQIGQLYQIFDIVGLQQS